MLNDRILQIFEQPRDSPLDLMTVQIKLPLYIPKRGIRCSFPVLISNN